MADRILTTHAGSLPRPDVLADLVWARIDGKDVDEGELEAQVDAAVVEVVGKQREVGLDVISDGEMSKSGFSTYVNDRFSGFAGRSEFQSDDVAPFPDLAMKLFATPSMARWSRPIRASEHEWRVWEDVPLPEGKKLIPGVVTHHTNVVEHPELVAQRLVRLANVVGRDNVLAGTDCGFAQGAFIHRVHPEIQWAKLAALAEGARIATKELWGAKAAA